MSSGAALQATSQIYRTQHGWAPKHNEYDWCRLQVIEPGEYAIVLKEQQTSSDGEYP